MSQVSVIEVSAGRFELLEVFGGPLGVAGGGAAPAVVASLPAGVVAAGWLLFADGSYVPRYAAGVSPPPPPPPPAFAPRLAYSDARNSQYLLCPVLLG